MPEIREVFDKPGEHPERLAAFVVRTVSSVA
jgi:hypothetical protein